MAYLKPRPPILRRKLSRPLRRGLGWIHEQATADFQAVADEHGTGAFAGTRRGEVEAALVWFERMLRESTNGLSSGRGFDSDRS